MVRILLVDEQKVIREGLRVLLESESDLEIVAAVSNGYAAISKIDETHPDILFISMKLSEIEGLDIIAIIRKKYSDVKIIIFSDRADEQHLIQSLEMGIKGYLLKDTPMEEIVEAIYLVDKGYTHIANDAYETVVPKISQTLSELNAAKPEIVFSDTSEYNDVSQWETTAATSANDNSDYLSNYEITTTDSAPETTSSTTAQSLLMDGTPVEETPDVVTLPSAQEQTNQGLNRYFSIISLASLGLLAISIGVISVISRRSPQLVIENAIINGKTISLNSPIQGKITKINYSKGASVSKDSVIATIEPLFGDRYTQETDRLQEQVKLKQQQQTVAQQSLNFLDNSLKTLEQELANGNPVQLDNLLKSIHFNQIKYQEIALKTARIREASVRKNYNDLLKLQKSKRVSESQVESAKNSWELSKLAIEEISTQLENTRQEYELIKQQIAGNQKQKDYKLAQEIERLKQQIKSQKISLNLLQTEITNLDSKLIVAVSEAVKNKSVSIKSPIEGAVYDQKYTEGEVVEIAEPIATVIDCNNLWVEATVEPQVTERINTQEPVLVTLTDSNLTLEGKISVIESLDNQQIDSPERAQEIAITTQVPSHLTETNYSRLIVRVPSVVDRLNEQQFCSVGQTARLSFGGEKDSLISQWQPKWLSNIIAALSTS